MAEPEPCLGLGKGADGRLMSVWSGVGACWNLVSSVGLGQELWNDVLQSHGLPTGPSPSYVVLVICLHHVTHYNLRS